MENEIKITTAINLSKYRKNSLLIGKIDPEMLASQESIDALRRTMDDLRKKVELDDSTTLFLTPEEFDVEAFDEDEMNGMGWIRKNKADLISIEEFESIFGEALEIHGAGEGTYRDTDYMIPELYKMLYKK